MPNSLLRSVLYIPATHDKAFDKIDTLPCDAFIIDLEDAIPPQMKETARERMRARFQRGFPTDSRPVVRINAPDSPWYHDDLAALEGLSLHAILVPKIRHPDDLRRVHADLSGLLITPHPVQIWGMVETPEILLHAATFSQAWQHGDFPTLSAWVLGINDLMKETGALPTPHRSTMLHWLSTTILLARSTRCLAIDGVCNQLENPAMFEDECLQGKHYGFDGKTIIHPRQLAAANRIFSPSSEEIAEAQALVDTFNLPENHGRGVIGFKGKMAETLHREVAERILARAQAIRQKGF